MIGTCTDEISDGLWDKILESIQDSSSPYDIHVIF